MARVFKLEDTRNIGIMAHIDAGKDHVDRAHPVLYGCDLQDRFGGRRHSHHGLDGAGTRARHHHYQRGDHRCVGPLRQEIPRQHYRYAGPRGLHRGSGAFAARAGRRGVRVRLRGGRAAAIGNGLAAGGQVSRAARLLREQDGPHGRGFRSCDSHHSPAAGRASGAAPISAGARRQFHRHHRFSRAESDRVARGNAGREVRDL